MSNKGGNQSDSEMEQQPLKSFYDILGCLPGADAVSIRSAWINKIKAFQANKHDLGVRNADSQIQQINFAYDVLKSSRLKTIYDVNLPQGEAIARQAVQQEQTNIPKFKKMQVKPIVKAKSVLARVDRRQQKHEQDQWRTELEQQKKDRQKAELEFQQKFHS